MPPVQTTYASTMALGFVGTVANMVPASYVSRTVETSAGIGFGLAVSQGAEDDSIVAYTDNVVGITVRERSVEAGADSFTEKQTARVMTEGAIVVSATGNVAAGDAVHVRAGGILAASGGQELANARWDTSATNGQLAVVRIGGPVPAPAEAP